MPRQWVSDDEKCSETTQIGYRCSKRADESGMCPQHFSKAFDRLFTKPKVPRQHEATITISGDTASVSLACGSVLPPFVQLIKAVPGRRFDWETKAWAIPADWADTVRMGLTQLGVMVT